MDGTHSPRESNTREPRRATQMLNPSISLSFHYVNYICSIIPFPAVQCALAGQVVLVAVENTVVVPVLLLHLVTVTTPLPVVFGPANRCAATPHWPVGSVPLTELRSVQVPAQSKLIATQAEIWSQSSMHDTTVMPSDCRLYMEPVDFDEDVTVPV